MNNRILAIALALVLVMFLSVAPVRVSADEICTHATLEEVPEKRAGCETNGYVGYWECSCGKWFADAAGTTEITDVSTSATGHNWGNYDYEKGSSEHYIQCTNQGCDIRVWEPHDLSISDDPLKGNYHIVSCACGLRETGAHTDTNGDGKCEACGHVMQQKEIEVQQHDQKTVTTGDPEKVDPHKTWLENWSDAMVPGNKEGSEKPVTQEQEDPDHQDPDQQEEDREDPAPQRTTVRKSAANSVAAVDEEAAPSGETPASTGVINRALRSIANFFGFFFNW